MSLTITKKTLVNPDQSTYDLHIVTPTTGKGVIVVPVIKIKDMVNIVLVDQWREAIERRTIELPRGTAADFTEQEALKELKEETNLTSSAIFPIGMVHPDTGLLTTQVQVYLARIDVPEVLDNYTFTNKYENDIKVVIYPLAKAERKLEESGCALSIAALSIAKQENLLR